MKRVLCLIFVIFSLCFLCVGCSSEKNGENITESTTERATETSSTTEKTTENQTEMTTENQTEKQPNSQPDKNDSTTTTTKKSQSNSTLSDEDLEKIKNTNAKVYFTDNPDNPHIIAVSEKYGAKKENLVALIKVDAEFPSATVFEFSGKTDENGELIMTYEEFEYMYEINEEENTIIKISKNCTDNDGVSFVEAKMFVTLAKTYLIPELQNLRENNRYPE